MFQYRNAFLNVNGLINETSSLLRPLSTSTILLSELHSINFEICVSPSFLLLLFRPYRHLHTESYKALLMLTNFQMMYFLNVLVFFKLTNNLTGAEIHKTFTVRNIRNLTFIRNIVGHLTNQIILINIFFSVFTHVKKQTLVKTCRLTDEHCMVYKEEQKSFWKRYSWNINIGVRLYFNKNYMYLHSYKLWSRNLVFLVNTCDLYFHFIKVAFCFT